MLLFFIILALCSGIMTGVTGYAVKKNLVMVAVTAAGIAVFSVLFTLLALGIVLIERLP